MATKGTKGATKGTKGATKGNVTPAPVFNDGDFVNVRTRKAAAGTRKPKLQADSSPMDAKLATVVLAYYKGFTARGGKIVEGKEGGMLLNGELMRWSAHGSYRDGDEGTDEGIPANWAGVTFRIARAAGAPELNVPGDFATGVNDAARDAMGSDVLYRMSWKNKSDTIKGGHHKRYVPGAFARVIMLACSRGQLRPDGTFAPGAQLEEVTGPKRTVAPDEA